MSPIRMIIAFCVCLPAVSALAGDSDSDSLVVSFSDPSSPGTIKTEILSGSITVRTHNSPDVLIISTDFNDENSTRNSRRVVRRGRHENSRFNIPKMPAMPAFLGGGLKFKNEPDPEKIKGLQKVQSSPFGINVEEDDNVIEINLPPRAFMSGGRDLLLLTPKRTSLQLSAMGGDVTISGISGEIEVEAMGGNINLTAISGAVVAHTMGDIEASIDGVEPDAPMSFSTFGGDIDVSLPPTIKATLILSSHGDIYTDFDTSKRKQRKKVQKDDDEDGFRVDVEKVLEIPINGGGPEIEFSNFTGDIYVRKGK